ncbi:MAG: cobyrinate a,c-diamide synthase [Nitrospirales bacterium]
MNLPRLVIAGTHSGVGKTTVTLALLAGFRSRGRTVQPFKAGPDFIDPGHHQLASGRESHNLDSWMLGACWNRSTFQRAAEDADLSIIEGMMGLFDGSSPINDIGSSAEIAKQLKAPVLLVVDGSAMARSAAAMVLGYANFDPELTIAGVVFNRIRSESHYQLLREAVEKETNVSIVGYLRADSELTIPDRHLGLPTALEEEGSAWYAKSIQATMNTLDFPRIEQLAQASPDWEEPVVTKDSQSAEPIETSLKIAVAHDPAFCFYYPENLFLLSQAGGRVVRFSPMNDAKLPVGVDMLYLGGGYPEVYASVLEQNAEMRSSIAAFIRQGGVAYAECGGLLYLSRSLQDFEGKVYDMVGVLPCDAVMSRTRMTLGYRELTLTRTGLLGEKGKRVRGHEFHYSHLENLGDVDYAGSMTDAQGNDRGGDGMIVNNGVALYTHLHFGSHPQVPSALMQASRNQRRRGDMR